MFCEEELAKLQYLQKQGYWIKQTTEGPEGLMRALSNALYFTESLHCEIQNAILKYLSDHRELLEIRSLFPHEDSVSLFEQSPSLPEFETVNLEIAARMLSAEITLLFLDDRDAVIVASLSQIKKKIVIVKLLENSYAAAFDQDIENIAIFSQNVILSVIKNVVSGSPFYNEELNKGAFLNFDYENWRKASGLTDHADRLDIDYRQNLYVNQLYSQCENEASLSASDQQSRGVSSKDSVGSVILAILESRRKNNPYGKAAGKLEQKLENLLASSDNTESINANSENFKLDQSTFIQAQSRDFEVFNVPSKPERPTFETYSNVITGMNDNLNKCIVIGDLNAIFKLRRDSQHNSMLNIENFVKESSDEQEPNDYEEGKTGANKFQPMKHDSSRNSMTDCQDKTQHELSAVFTEDASDKRQQCNDSSIQDLINANSLQLPSSHCANEHHQSLATPSGKMPIYFQSRQDDLSDVRQNEIRKLSQKAAEDIDQNSQPFIWRPDSAVRQERGCKISGILAATSSFQSSRLFKPFEVLDDLGDNRKACIDKLDFIAYLTDRSIFGGPNKIDCESNLADLSKPVNHQQNALEATKGHAEKPKEDFGKPTEVLATQKKKRYREKISKTYHTGFLKFFDENKGYGFVTVTDKVEPFDVFVYRNELKHANVESHITRKVKKGAQLFLRFRIAKYTSKSGNSKKALNLEVIDCKLP